MSEATEHERCMGVALEEASIALDTQEVPVGCVFVHPREGLVGRYPDLRAPTLN